MAELRVREIYRSIQGESTFAGWPCVFVRTAGCDIRCTYCDEPHALTAAGGEMLSVEEVLARVAAFGARMVEITGGEPLLQKTVPELVARLCDAGYTTLIETGGHHDISVLDPRSHAIVDVKTPGSRMAAHNDRGNLARLRAGDELKFVLCDRADYDWAVALVREHGLEGTGAGELLARAPRARSRAARAVDRRRRPARAPQPAAAQVHLGFGRDRRVDCAR